MGSGERILTSAIKRTTEWNHDGGLRVEVPA
jgi:hypothetical protein